MGELRDWEISEISLRFFLVNPLRGPGRVPSLYKKHTRAAAVDSWLLVAAPIDARGIPCTSID